MEALALGAGIPVGWTVVAEQHSTAAGGSGSAFVVAVGAVAGTYVVLAAIASLVAGRAKRRSRARRMRQPWERG